MPTRFHFRVNKKFESKIISRFEKVIRNNESNIDGKFGVVRLSWEHLSFAPRKDITN